MKVCQRCGTSKAARVKYCRACGPIVQDEQKRTREQQGRPSAGWLKAPKRNLSVVKSFLLNGGSAWEAGRGQDLSNPQAWRVVQEMLGEEGYAVAEKVLGFAVYVTFQLLRDYRKVAQIFGLGVRRTREEAAEVHDMLVAEQQGSLLELFSCQRCGERFESDEPIRRYCESCRPAVTAELTKVRVARWKERNPEKARLLEKKSKLKLRLKKLELRYSVLTENSLGKREQSRKGGDNV